MARRWIQELRKRPGALFGGVLVALILVVAFGGAKIGAPAVMSRVDAQVANKPALVVQAADEPSGEQDFVGSTKDLAEKVSSDLLVRVVDAGGTPLSGVDVELRVDQGFGTSTLGAPEATRKDGVATFLRSRELLAEYGKSSAQLEVCFAGADAPPVSLRFPVRRIPQRVLTLVLPDSTDALPGSDSELSEPIATSDLPAPIVPVVVVSEEPHPEVATAAGTVQLAPAAEETTSEAEQAPREAAAAPTPSAAPLAPASLVGRLLVDEGVPLDILRIELEEVLPLNRSAGKFHAAKALNANGEFRFEDVSPGLIAIRVSLWGMAGTLAWVDEIELEEGEVRSDISLCEVDLTGRLFAAEVEVLDEFGLRIEPAVVMPFYQRTLEHGTPRVQDAGSTARVWMDQSGIDLLAVAQDYAPKQLHLDPMARDFGSVHRMALVERAVGEVELRFLDRELLDGLPDGYQLRAELRRRDGLRYPWDRDRHRGEFDDRGRLRMAPADCGDFEVFLSLVSPDGEVRELARQPDRVAIAPENQDPAAALQVVHLRGFSSSLRVSK